MKHAAILVAALLTGCHTAQVRPTVRIATTGAGFQSFSLSLHVAQALGYFDEENLTVAVEPAASAGRALQALVAGSAEVATVAYGQVLQLAAQNQRLRTFFILTRRGNIAIIAAPAASNRIRTTADLKGALIGVSSPGAPTHQFVNYYLARHGIATSDFRTVGVGMGPPAVAALESARVDAAAVASGELLVLAQRYPNLRILIDSSTVEGMREIYGAEEYASGALAARPEWLDANTDTARRLARAFQRTHVWIAAHTPEEVLDKLPPASRSPDRNLDIAITQWAISVYTRDGRMPPAAPAIMLRYIREAVPELRDATINTAAAWTDEFLR